VTKKIFIFLKIYTRIQEIAIAAGESNFFSGGPYKYYSF
jgi:hypothetical protein